MPKELIQYYRYRKMYAPAVYNLPEFSHIQDMDEDLMRHSLPNDCNGLPYSFTWYEGDRLMIDYFEDEEDCMCAKAVTLNNHDIYKNWKKEQKEERLLRGINKKV